MFGELTYVHDAAVDIAELLEAEEARSVGGIIEDETLGGWSGEQFSPLCTAFHETYRRGVYRHCP